jgi:hypothetical protein
MGKIRLYTWNKKLLKQEKEESAVQVLWAKAFITGVTGTNLAPPVQQQL